jgi:hypothetical protein
MIFLKSYEAVLFSDEIEYKLCTTKVHFYDRYILTSPFIFLTQYLFTDVVLVAFSNKSKGA